MKPAVIWGVYLECLDTTLPRTQEVSMWHDMNWHGWDGHMFSWWGIIVMGVLIVAAAAIISRAESEQPASDTALDILERRYAQGDIDHDEFEQKRRDLQD
jgi:putative membrane protein